ncbi:MAG: hypothetical protein K2X47_05480 [Bdellovibrionales bacterium]|nr:hypothetical protein [Bdellovibrionales bacterium]
MHKKECDENLESVESTHNLSPAQILEIRKSLYSLGVERWSTRMPDCPADYFGARVEFIDTSGAFIYEMKESTCGTDPTEKYPNYEGVVVNTDLVFEKILKIAEAG